MRLRQALRLRPGDTITFGDAGSNRRCTMWWEGVVICVTPRGGIKVRIVDRAPWSGARRRDDQIVTWVPYHHIAG